MTDLDNRAVLLTGADPVLVVSKIIEDIQRDSLHVFPHKMVRQVQIVKGRFAALFGRMRRWLERKFTAQEHPADPMTSVSYRARIIRFVSKLMFRHISSDSNVVLIRESFEKTQGRRGAARGVKSRDAIVAGIDCLWLVPHGCEHAPVFYYLHGGGYLMGSPRTHRKMVSHIARAAGVRALLPDYSLAPENPYPAGLNDCLAVYRGLLESGIEADDIIIGGDSAGGGMSMAAMLSLREAGDEMPMAAVLLSPWLDLTASGESMSSRLQVEPWFKPDEMIDVARMYCPRGDLADPLLSPVFADAAGLPPLLIQVGDHEILLSDSIRLADNISASGGKVTLQVWQQMWHVFQIFVGQMPESARAISDIATFIKEQTATES